MKLILEKINVHYKPSVGLIMLTGNIKSITSEVPLLLMHDMELNQQQTSLFSGTLNKYALLRCDNYIYSDSMDGLIEQLIPTVDEIIRKVGIKKRTIIKYNTVHTATLTVHKESYEIARAIRNNLL